MPCRLSDSPVKDITEAPRREFLFRPPAPVDDWLQSVCVNPKDAAMAFSLFNVVVTVVPSVLLLFLLPFDALFGAYGTAVFWTAAVAHVGSTYFMWALRFILTLHYAAHRKPFRVGDGASFVSRTATALLNSLPSVFLSPFFGIPSGSYYLHHCVMHHNENNVLPYDVSSTQAYQRDSVLHFMHYWLRYLFAALIELPIYAFMKRRWTLLAQFLAVLSTYCVVVSRLYAFNARATVAVFFIPYVVSSVLLMLGNFSQHIFVDPDRHNNSYALTYNLVDSPENAFAYNDGYHIIHHVNSRLHWSEMPQAFVNSLDKHAAQDAFVFRGLTFMDVGIMAFTGRLDKLADHFVHYGQKERTHDEVVAEFKRRLVPIPADTPLPNQRAAGADKPKAA